MPISIRNCIPKFPVKIHVIQSFNTCYRPSHHFAYFFTIFTLNFTISPDKVNSGFYYEAGCHPRQTSDRSVDEHSDSTFDSTTDDPDGTK